MKQYLTKVMLIGAFSMVACKERPQQVSKEINDTIADLTSHHQAETKKAKRKAWPPASKESVENQTSENYLVVLDNSGSMAGKKMDQAKTALNALADTLAPEHNLGLILLNGNANVPLGTGNRDTFKKVVFAASAGGGTPLSQSTSTAYNTITAQASRQQGYGCYHMIIVTDGESSDGSPMDLVRKVVENTSVQVHVIGFHVASHEMNNPRYVDYHTARNANELSKAFEDVAAETNEFSDPKEFTQ